MKPEQENKILQVLDKCYGMALNGIPKVSKSVEEFAEDYIRKYGYTDEAISKMISYQIMKCGTSGFLTGIGGLITLPVAIPANISSVLYVQLRMIAAIAYIRGFNPSDDEVQSLAYACLLGSSMSNVLKAAGIEFTEKLTLAAIKKIPGSVLTKINQKVGFRFITKAGERGIINMTKLVPIVGGVIGGGVDISSTTIIAKNAKKLFSSQRGDVLIEA